MRPILVLLALVIIIGGIQPQQPVIAGTQIAPHANPVEPGNTSLQEDNSFWHNWTSPANISQCPANQATYPSLGVTAGGQTIYLAWTDGRALSKDVYYATSTDRGWNWGDPQPVVATAADSWRPSLVVSASVPSLAWAETTLTWNRATHQLALGETSSAIVPNAHDVLAYAPRLALGPGGELHLVLQGGLGTQQPDILYSRLDAGATAWPTATVVFTHTASGSYNPAIAVSADGQIVHLVWQENVSGAQSTIYYLQGQRDGADVLWGTPLAISEGITRSVRPAIVLGAAPAQQTQDEVSEVKEMANQTIHVVWGEQASGFEQQYIRYSRSDDGGAHWSTPSRIDPQPVSANNVSPTDVAPALAIAPSGALCAAWHGFRSGAPLEAEEIYLTCSTDQGSSWGTPVNVSLSSSTISIRPVLGIGSDGILHLSWQEYAGPSAVSDYQIYYARSLPYSVMLPLIRR